MQWERNKGGRPKKEESEKRTMNIRVRFTGSEYQQLQSRMVRTSAPDISTFVRALCLEKPLQLSVPSSTQEDRMMDLIREIRVEITRIGHHINQSVKRINSTTDHQDLQKQTQEMSTQMQEIDHKLRSLISAFNYKG